MAEDYARRALDTTRKLPDVEERKALEELVEFVVERIPVESAA